MEDLLQSMNLQCYHPQCTLGFTLGVVHAMGWSNVYDIVTIVVSWRVGSQAHYPKSPLSSLPLLFLLFKNVMTGKFKITCVAHICGLHYISFGQYCPGGILNLKGKK